MPASTLYSAVSHQFSIPIIGIFYPEILTHAICLTPRAYLITLSARASTFGGIVRPICLAAFRLMMNSNFIGCYTGRSAGLVPLRILSTKVAARRSKSLISHAVGDKPPDFHILSPFVHRREPALYCQFCNLCLLRNEEGARERNGDRDEHALCSRLGMRSQYPRDLLRLGIEAAPSYAPAASSISFNTCALPGLVEVPRTPTRASRGTIYFKSSNCFPLISRARVDNPVMFPPGRARLATKPEPTGSLSNAMTMGIVEVASLAERVAVGPPERS